jgi:hypothetical protein
MLFGLILFPLCLCCVHMHAFVLLFSHLYLLVCVRLLASLVLICNVFCIHGFVSSSCMVNICLATIMTRNPACTFIIIFITSVLFCGPGSLSQYSDWLCPGRSRVWVHVGGEIFSSCPDRPWGPPCLLYRGYWVFPRGKEVGAWPWQPTPI